MLLTTGFKGSVLDINDLFICEILDSVGVISSENVLIRLGSDFSKHNSCLLTEDIPIFVCRKVKVGGLRPLSNMLLVDAPSLAEDEVEDVPFEMVHHWS